MAQKAIEDMTTEASQTSPNGPDYSSLGAMVQSGMIGPLSKNRSKRRAMSEQQQVAWDPDNSVKLPVEWTPPGDGTSAENFRAILEQLPRSPGSLKRIRAWQSYDEALKIAGGKTDSSAKHSVTESNGKPKFSSILSALCNEEVQHSNSLKKETRKASTVHGLTIEEHEHSPHQSVDHAHNVSIKSEPNSASSMSILPDKAKNRIHAVLSRYAGAADRPELSNMIQQKRAEEIKAGQELNDITTLAWRRKHKKWDRYKQYREGTLGKKHSSRQANRVNRKGSQKRSQPVQVNEKRTSQKKQKNALDGLFAEAGY